MRRRRKPRVVWLPPTEIGAVDAGSSGDSTWHVETASIGAPGAVGDVAGFEVPILADRLSDVLDPVTSISDIENSGYRLRRIVGKIYVTLGSSGSTNERPLVGCTAGLIIRRTSPRNGQSLAAQFNADEIRPDNVEQSMDPWIWRRNWLLQPGTTIGAGGSDETFGLLRTTDFPQANWGWQYPGPLEGPHVDQKTARIIGQEERLFLDFSMQLVNTGTAFDTISAAVFYDFRCLGSMRMNVGNRRNASR